MNAERFVHGIILSGVITIGVLAAFVVIGTFVEIAMWLT